MSARTSRFVVVGVLLSALLVHAQEPAPLIFHGGRLAFNHDGNASDIDDVGAVPWEWGVMWAFGLADKFVHMDYNCLIGRGNQWEQLMIESAKEGPRHFPGFDSTKLFNDLNLAERSAGVANFAVQAEAGGPGDTLVFICAAPMEMAWQCLNAVAKDKLQYVKCISHATWNDTYTDGQSRHTWNNMKADFPQVTYVHISDQNANLGGGSNWSFLSSMPEVNGLDPSAWTWMKSRDRKNGDVSDVGMLWYILTGNENARPADFERRFKNPVIPVVSVLTPLVKERTNAGILTKLTGLGRTYDIAGRIVSSEERPAAGVRILNSAAGTVKAAKVMPVQ